eukprot:SM002178S06657  [mRNA]  locus=s2178:742:906:- [translate_table: standard]
MTCRRGKAILTTLCGEHKVQARAPVLCSSWVAKERERASGRSGARAGRCSIWGP